MTLASEKLGIHSMKQRCFDFQISELLNALESGRDIILKNLHKNPILQQQLEGLCQSPPRLLINGELRFFKNVRVWTILPVDIQFASPVWNKARCNELNYSREDSFSNSQESIPAAPH